MPLVYSSQHYFLSLCCRGQVRKTRQPYVSHCIETALIVEGLLSPTEEDERWVGLGWTELGCVLPFRFVLLGWMGVGAVLTVGRPLSPLRGGRAVGAVCSHAWSVNTSGGCCFPACLFGLAGWAAINMRQNQDGGGGSVPRRLLKPPP